MEDLVLTWWMWFVFGIVLLIAEFLTPGAFYQFFFGLGAIAVGVVGLVGFDLHFPAQIGLFLVLSIGSLVLLRKPLRVRFTSAPEEDVDRIEGKTAVALARIRPGEIGKAELRGAVWNARNVGESAIAKSQRCRIVHVDGLTLEIEA